MTWLRLGDRILNLDRVSRIERYRDRSALYVRIYYGAGYDELRDDEALALWEYIKRQAEEVQRAEERHA